MKRLTFLPVVALVATVAMVACGRSAQDDRPVLAMVPSATADAVTVDYASGAWVLTRSADGRAVTVDCPTEDTCSVSYEDGRYVVRWDAA